MCVVVIVAARSIPQRHITAILTFLTVLTIGMLGNSLPLIITQMVKPITSNQTLYAMIGNERKNEHPELSCPLPIVERQPNSTRNLKLVSSLTMVFAEAKFIRYGDFGNENFLIFFWWPTGSIFYYNAVSPYLRVHSPTMKVKRNGGTLSNAIKTYIPMTTLLRRFTAAN